MLHFYNTSLNLLNISSLFSSEIVISSTFLRFSSGSQFYHRMTYLLPLQFYLLKIYILYGLLLLEVVLKESRPVFNDCFSCFLAIQKNKFPLTSFLLLGSIQHRCISKLEEGVISVD